MKKKMNKKVADNKCFKQIVGVIENMVGFDTTGKLIAILADTLISFAEDVDEGRYKNMRTIEITINNFISKKYNFEIDNYEESEAKKDE